MRRERGYRYRHIWPITDPERPISALRAEAAGALDALAAVAGARQGWTVDEVATGGGARGGVAA